MPALTGLRLTTVYGERVDVACAAVLLDMDGTLVDSSACVEAKWRWWSKRYGVDPNTVLAVAHGRRLDDTIRHTAPHLDLDRTVAELARHEEQETTGLDVVPGAPELLAALPAGTWAVVTSAWRTLAQIRLRHVGLSVPEVLVTADDTPRASPTRTATLSPPPGWPARPPTAWWSRTVRSASAPATPPACASSASAPPLPHPSSTPTGSSRTSAPCAVTNPRRP